MAEQVEVLFGVKTVGAQLTFCEMGALIPFCMGEGSG